MPGAKEGSRTPTRVTPLEPEAASLRGITESVREVSSGGCVGVVTQYAARNGRAPTNSGACTTTPIGEIRPGDRVVVIAGLASGLTGRVLERTRIMFGPLPTFAVELPGSLGVRVIRADYLQVVA